MKVGLQTTFDRPIINTRDESHSTDEYRRLHVIVGDANRMDVPQALKLGTTSMLLWLLEHAEEAGLNMDEALRPTTLADPVRAMHEVSHDLTLGAALPLEYGGETTAWQIEITLRSLVYAAAAVVYGTDTSGEPAWPDRSTRNIMAMWGQALADVAAIRHADDDTRLAMHGEASRVEWLLKWQLLEKLRRKIGSGWGDARIAAVDLKWAAIDPADSIFDRLRAQTERLVMDEQLEQASVEAPSTTRAWLRAEIIRRFPEQVVAASWSRLTVRHRTISDNTVENPMVSLDMSDPLKYGKSQCSGYCERVQDAASILEMLR
jgi:proteasome accessory factor A